MTQQDGRTRIAVLGGGRVGAAMVRDLATESRFDVVLADLSEAALAAFAGDPAVTTRRVDLGAAGELEQAIADRDLVVGAVPGPMGYETVRRVIDAGKPVADISFFEQDAYGLDALARERGVALVVDAGVAPGMSNLLLGHMESRLERVDSFVCYVGGLPVERRWPWEYRAPFSPIDVLAEYTRPARLREAGREVVRPALSRCERVEIPGLGSLEAFETDGLRTLLRTSRCPNLVEKTMRYPGHADKIEVLREAGFLSEQVVTLRDGSRVRPLDLAAHLLFPAWQPQPGEQELTVMKVVVEGVDTAAGRPGRRVRHSWDLLDRTAADGTSSMARTTGYVCTAVARAMAEGLWTRPGVAPPEDLGRDAACFDRIVAHLASRDVIYHHREDDLGAA